MKRIVIIGLDGVPHGLIRNLTRNGTMPATRELVEKGLFRRMESSIPEVSSVAWSSIITGKNPGEHGIFGYTDIPIGTYRLSFPNFNHLRASPFWQGDGRGKSVIINVPGTFPVKPLNGVHISGFVSLDLERSVYPKSLIPTLADLNYRIDVDSSKAHQSKELFLSELNRTLKARIDAYRYLWRKERWETFVLVFTGTDRLSHFLWDAYQNPGHRYHSSFLDHFHRIDEVIGEIVEGLSEDDFLIVLSDHGFELLEREVNVNFLLMETGFLRLKSGSKANFADIDFGTKAFALDPARLYVNLRDKYPRGSVNEREYGRIVEELIEVFDNLELAGRRVVKGIFRKGELYRGPYAEQAPDVVLLPNRGFNLRSNIRAKTLSEKSMFTGKHTQHDAFLLISRDLGKDVIPLQPSVFAVCDIINGLRSEKNALPKTKNPISPEVKNAQ